MENQTIQQPPTGFQMVMVPMMLPAPPKPLEEKKPDDSPSMATNIFWMAMIGLGIWFITSGWKFMK